jgi:hypothetical protein
LGGGGNELREVIKCADVEQGELGGERALGQDEESR